MDAIVGALVMCTTCGSPAQPSSSTRRPPGSASNAVSHWVLCPWRQPLAAHAEHTAPFNLPEHKSSCRRLAVRASCCAWQQRHPDSVRWPCALCQEAPSVGVDACLLVGVDACLFVSLIRQIAVVWCVRSDNKQSQIPPMPACPSRSWVYSSF